MRPRLALPTSTVTASIGDLVVDRIAHSREVGLFDPTKHKKLWKLDPAERAIAVSV
jgi:hypothetical protein